MKRLNLVVTAVSLACISLSAIASKPHPTNAYGDALNGNVSCTCDWLADPTMCTVSWPDVGASAYGVSVEFEAEWSEGEVGMESSSELSLDDNWACDELSATCSASGEFALPEYPADAETKFHGKVKGFDNGEDGARPRDYVKATGECNLP